jgi:hypothetical protein
LVIAEESCLLGVDAETAFYAEFERLVQVALGPLASDPSAAAAVSTILGAGTYSSLRARGLITSEAADLVADLLWHWLVHKVAFAGRGLTDPGTSDTMREP